ncbi:MAG: hypothetical protein ACFFA3_18615 [Promethearchaeota archaeon]
MAKKNIILIFILIISGLSVDIYLPTVFLSSGLQSYDIIEESEIWYFPEDLSPQVDLSIITDVGNIKIEYVEPSFSTYGKINVIFNIAGSDLAGKSYTDYFSLNYQTTNSRANFTLEVLSDDWFDTSLWSLRNISIIISLRSDVIFNINATLEYGDFDLVVPYGVSIGNIHIKISSGNILYNFNHCIIDGNITGITNKGDLNLQSYNVEYTQNHNWMLNSTDGDMTIAISQYKEMGANITGTAMIINSDLDLFYNDTSSDIGAIFYFPCVSQDPAIGGGGFAGASKGVGVIYTSLDFPTKNNYNLTFYLPDISQDHNLYIHSD